MPLHNAALLLLLLLSPQAACGALTRATYGNTVFGLPAALDESPNVALPPTTPGAPFSVLFTGTIAPPAVESLFFSATTDGVLRLYIDDHLVLDDSASGCARTIHSWLNFPARSTAPVPLRLEYSHPSAACGAPALALHWEGNSTARADVPASALAPAPTAGPRAELAALRTRLYEPLVPWQTYFAPHMGAHALQPTGLVLSFSIGDLAGRWLGELRPFPSFQPAAVAPGGHSLNGSDYTALHVSRWGAHNATVSLFTTAAAAGGGGGACSGTLGAGAAARCDLALVAACQGSDCAQLVLVASLSYAWLGAGSAGVEGNATLAATPAGFAPVSARALTPGAALPPAGAKFPPASLQLPFAAVADLPWAGPGGGAAVAVAALCTAGGSGGGGGGAAPAASSLAQAIALVAAARARYEGSAAARGFSPRAAAAYEPMRAVLGWNVIFTHFLGVYTPVSRDWAAPDQISTFVWDIFFASVMLSLDAPADARAADLAAANTITTLFSRTMSGMVPNYATGAQGTYDRTEPQLGSWTVRVLRDRLGARYSWLAPLVVDVLVGWSDWFDRYRRSDAGVLAAGGAGGSADALSLGSNAVSPGGLNTPHTLAAARYESGLDNSPQYDGDDSLCSGAVCPCTFNATSSLMNLYDVAFTSYYALDAAELQVLAAGLNRSDFSARMAQRAQRAAAALHDDLFAPQLGHGAGTYCNRLLNGSWVPRWAPTVFAPMLLGSVPRARIDGMMQLLADETVFCVNASFRGTGAAAAPAPLALLLNFPGGSGGGVDACVTDACIVAAVQSRYGVAPELQGNIAGDASGPAAVPLLRFVSARGSGAASALVTAPFAAAPLAANYSRVGGVEGYCFGAPPPGVDSTPLVLWQGPAAFVTCGTAACNASAAQAGLLPAGTLCHAGAAVTPSQRACTVPLPSIGRSDAAFGEQTYWRGRAWAPQAFLVWLGLQRYADVPSAAARRADLVAMASAVYQRQWVNFAQVNENLDGLLGLGSDSVRADSFYHWGALSGFMVLVEEGLYPVGILAAPAQQG
jgi:hypothetical protein